MRCGSTAAAHRCALESLEPRLLLTNAPVFVTELDDIFLPADGTALTLGLDTFDEDGDPIMLSAVSDDPNLTVIVPQGNRFARLNIVESDGVTPVGEMVFQLLEDRFDVDGVNPNTERFVALSTTGFDDEGEIDPLAPPFWSNMNIHRISTDFVIQSGDAQNSDGTGNSPLGDFDGQVDPTLASFAASGVLAFANMGSNPSTSDGQIFVTHDVAAFLNNAFAIIGQLITGQDVFDDLNGRPVNGDVPVDPPIITSIDIFESDEDGTITLVGEGFDPGAITIELFDASLGAPPEAPTWQFQEQPGPGGEVSVRTIVGDAYVFDTTAHDDIQAGHGVDLLQQPLTLDTDDGYELDFRLLVEEESHATVNRAGFSVIAIGSDPTQSLEIAFWEDEVWVYDYDRDALAQGQEDFLHGAGFALDTTIAHDYQLRVENDEFSLLVDGEEMLSGPLVDYTGSRPLPAPYDIPNAVVIGDDTSRAEARVEVLSVSFNNSVSNGDDNGEDGGAFDGRAALTVMLDDGDGHITEETVNVLIVGDRPTITDPGRFNVDPDTTSTFDVTINDDFNAPLDVIITTEQENVDLSIVKAAATNTYTVTVIVPDSKIVFDATISAVETGFSDIDSIEPTLQTVTISTVGDAPELSLEFDEPLDLAQGQIETLQLIATDDLGDDLEVTLESDQPDVVLTQPVLVEGQADLYEFTIELPDNRDLQTEITVNVSEVGLETGPHTTQTFIVTTIGDRPTISNPGLQDLVPGETAMFDVTIEDDLDADLDVQITTDTEDVELTIEQIDEDDETLYTVTVTMPEQNLLPFNATITAVEAGFDDVESVVPTERVFSLSTTGSAPVIVDAPDRVDLEPAEVHVFNVEITDDKDVELDLEIEADNEDVAVSIEPVDGFDDMYMVTIELPDEHVHTNVTISASEADLDLTFARTSDAFLVTTLMERPQINGPDNIFIELEVPTVFTPDIFDDGGLDMDVTVSSTDASVTAEIDDETHDITFTPADGNYHSFRITVTAVESGFDNVSPAVQTFDVFTGAGLVETATGDLTFASTVVGDIMYVANGTDGLRIYDVTDPTAAILLGQRGTTGRVIDVEVVGTTAFLADFDNGFVVLDVGDPGSISQLDQADPPDGGESIDVLIDGDIAYVSHATGGLTQYDVADPSNIVELTSVKSLGGGEELSDAFWLEKKDAFLFVGDRAGGGVKVFDVTFPGVIRHLDTFYDGNDMAGMDLVGDLLYVIDRAENRLLIWDVSRPTRARLISDNLLDGGAIRVLVIETTAIVSQSDGYLFLDVSDPEFVVLDREFIAADRGVDPLIFDGLIALPVGDDGQIVLIDAGDLNRRTVITGRETITDDSGVNVTIRLTGPGMIVANTTNENAGDIQRLRIFGTAINSSVTISTDGGFTTIGEVFISGFLNRFSGSDVDLAGDFSANGIVKRLTLHDIVAVSTISIGGSFRPRDKVTFTVNRAADMTLNSVMPLRRFDAVNVADTDDTADLINVPFIDRLDVEFDFESDMLLRGFGNPRRTLGRADIGRDIPGGTWNITGDTGVVSAAGTIEDWTLNVMSNVTALLLGDVVSATISVDDVIRRIRADRVQSAEINADQILDLRVTGNDAAAVPGDVTADINARILRRATVDGDLIDSNITLTGQSATQTALTTLTVHGRMTNSSLKADGRMSRITLGALLDSIIYADVDASVGDDLPQDAAGFDAMARINRLRVTGLDAEPFDVINAKIAVWELRDVSLVGVLNDNGGEPWGLVAHDIRRLTQPDLGPGDDPIGGGGVDNDSILRLV